MNKLAKALLHSENMEGLTIRVDDKDFASFSEELSSKLDSRTGVEYQQYSDFCRETGRPENDSIKKAFVMAKFSEFMGDKPVEISYVGLRVSLINGPGGRTEMCVSFPGTIEQVEEADRALEGFIGLMVSVGGAGLAISEAAGGGRTLRIGDQIIGLPMENVFTQGTRFKIFEWEGEDPKVLLDGELMDVIPSLVAVGNAYGGPPKFTLLGYQEQRDPLEVLKDKKSHYQSAFSGGAAQPTPPAGREAALTLGELGTYAGTVEAVIKGEIRGLITQNAGIAGIAPALTEDIAGRVDWTFKFVRAAYTLAEGLDTVAAERLRLGEEPREPPVAGILDPKTEPSFHDVEKSFGSFVEELTEEQERCARFCESFESYCELCNDNKELHLEKIEVYRERLSCERSITDIPEFDQEKNRKVSGIPVPEPEPVVISDEELEKAYEEYTTAWNKEKRVKMSEDEYLTSIPFLKRSNEYLIIRDCLSALSILKRFNDTHNNPHGVHSFAARACLQLAAGEIASLETLLQKRSKELEKELGIDGAAQGGGNSGTGAAQGGGTETDPGKIDMASGAASATDAAAQDQTPGKATDGKSLELTADERQQLAECGIHRDMVYRHESGHLAVHVGYIKLMQENFTSVRENVQLYIQSYKRNYRTYYNRAAPENAHGDIGTISVPANVPEKQLDEVGYISLKYAQVVATATRNFEGFRIAYGQEAENLATLIRKRNAEPQPRPAAPPRRSEPVVPAVEEGDKHGYVPKPIPPMPTIPVVRGRKPRPGTKENEGDENKEKDDE
jgi:hypothetical protein